MNYVKVRFPDNPVNGPYIYMVPPYIDFEKIYIGGWVIVEDIFWVCGSANPPYKIVKVVDKGSTMDYAELDIIPTKYIADAVRGDEYRQVREEAKKAAEFDEGLIDMFKKLPRHKRIMVLDCINSFM